MSKLKDYFVKYGKPVQTKEELGREPQPIDNVLWVPIDLVVSNQYNPNHVAKVELKLLYTSIKHDKYTQPIVTIYDDQLDKFVVVDGFHRYYVCKSNKDIYEMNNGLVPVVVIDKDINDRMASTVRHNRARGKHSVTGMSTIVFSMLENGMTEEEVCNELGMEAEELLRLKYITGFSKLFEDHQYRKSWKTKHMVRLQKKYLEEHPEEQELKSKE